MEANSDVIYEKLKCLDRRLRDECQDLEKKILYYPFCDEVISKLKDKKCKKNEQEMRCSLAEMYGRREALASVADELIRIRKDLVGK